ncbi:MAG: RNA-binding protein [Candidatus Cloacimonetes bacterium]|nr:RNA-binding protein [Candidatus Cloacimonadota bacterium]
MRVDQLLNKLCLFKTRSMAKKACDLDLVSINGKVSKASAEVRDADEIRYTVYNWQYTVRIVKVPEGNVSKATAGEYYELLKKKQKPD